MPTTSQRPPADPPATELLPANVIEAIRRVMVELPGIGKLSPDEHRKAGHTGGGDDRISYSYRSLEQITGQAQALFGRYGVVFVPTVEEHEEKEITLGQRGTRWTDTYLKVTYRIFGPGGIDDVLEVGPVVGIGRDNADKGTNKAMSQCFKQVLLQVLCVGDPQDDGDHQRHEVEQGPTEELATRGDLQKIGAALRMAPSKDRYQAVTAKVVEAFGPGEELPRRQVPAVLALIAEELRPREEEPTELEPAAEGAGGPPSSAPAEEPVHPELEAEEATDEGPSEAELDESEVDRMAGASS